MFYRTFGATCLLLGFCLADIYLSNPKGSNNRLNEKSNNRKNGNRLFDSQNNDKGGYNVAEKGSEEAESYKEQYRMQYYESGPDRKNDFSRLVVEWTGQHGCGDNPKVSCNVVIQYMCMNNLEKKEYPEGQGNKDEDFKRRGFFLRDGENTDTQQYTEPTEDEDDQEFRNRMEKNYQNSQASRGLHESLEYYDICRHREANGGLYHADQSLGRDKIGYRSSRRTRQNRGGTRHGYECPEERDYYPYWSPTIQGRFDRKYQRTPWIDAACLGSNCKDAVRESFNTNAKFMCILDANRNSESRYYGKSITKKECQDEGGSWVKFESFLEVLTDKKESECNDLAKEVSSVKISWKPLRSDSKTSVCVVQALPPISDDAPTTRVNHLGNTKQLTASRFNWNLPHFPSGDEKRCVLRIRYNISTTDYDKLTSEHDYMPRPIGVTDDPDIDVFGVGNGKGLTLAVNTAQFGRTFQDRSHVFVVLSRDKAMEGKKLFNLNVRGQRGNIVQNYPSVEYDFVPDDMTVSRNDLVHVQWAGYNTNVPNRDGEGKDGTDRNNFVEMDGDSSTSYPKVIEDSVFWNNVESLTKPDLKSKDLAIDLGTVGYLKYCPLKSGDDVREVISKRSSPEGNKEAIAECPENYSVIGCRCAKGFPVGAECNGARIIDGKCVVTSSSTVVRAHATCSKRTVPGKLAYIRKRAYREEKMKHGCPKGYKQLMCIYHSPSRLNSKEPIVEINADATIKNGCTFTCPPSNKFCDATAICLEEGNNERSEVPCPAAGNKDDLQGQLDNAPASFFGHVLKFNKAVTLKYMCTRNNNFSNRSQKGMLKVVHHGAPSM